MLSIAQNGEDGEGLRLEKVVSRFQDWTPIFFINYQVSFFRELFPKNGNTIVTVLFKISRGTENGGERPKWFIECN